MEKGKISIEKKRVKYLSAKIEVFGDCELQQYNVNLNETFVDIENNYVKYKFTL